MCERSSSVRFGHLVLALWLTLASGQLMACTQVDDAELRLSWTFGDTRSCLNSGISMITVRVISSSTLERSFTCVEGFEPNVVRLGPLEYGVVALELELTGPQGERIHRMSMRQAIDQDQVQVSLRLP